MSPQIINSVGMLAVLGLAGWHGYHRTKRQDLPWDNRALSALEVIGLICTLAICFIAGVFGHIILEAGVIGLCGLWNAWQAAGGPESGFASALIVFAAIALVGSALLYLFGFIVGVMLAYTKADDPAKGSQAATPPAPPATPPAPPASNPYLDGKRRGTVKWFNQQKGYGFIQPDGGGRDVFVQISAVIRAGLRTLTEGQRVSFDVVTYRGASAAENLELIIS